jgi:hypothetical protein
MSNTTAPVVTAAVHVTPLGDAYLHVEVDGEPITFEMSMHSLRLRRIDPVGEAERLLKRHAGYAPTGEWQADEHGHLVATVTEIDGRCTTCVHGCGCEIGSTGCGHYQCPAATADSANTCGGAALALAARRTYPTARQAERAHRR